MGLGNGYSKASNKGSGFGFEFRNLQLLGSILKALGGSPVTNIRIPSAFRTTAAGTVASGSQSVSIYNSGTVAGTVFGSTALNPGERISFTADDQADSLDVIEYDATAAGAEFLITTLI
tara:strand:+ start:1349 stop:1705 length:357 start_codon:yes stop_codon:yes gene_type:complete